MSRGVVIGRDPHVGSGDRRLIFGEELESMTAAELEAAIEKRLQAARHCVGGLYPSILLAEVQVLREQWRRL